MKQKIHPKFNNNCQVKCACGNTFVTGSTKESVYVEICSHCHPFYTGKQKLVDTARRVEKFQAKAVKTQKIKSTQKKTDKRGRKTRSKKEQPAAQPTADKI